MDQSSSEIFTTRDASQRAPGCMQQGGHVEVCHSQASVGSATPSGLGRNQSAARPVQLKVKEALHIERTLANNRLNRDGDYELPGCWITTMKKLGRGGNRASANHTGAPPTAPGCMGVRAQ